MLRAAFEVLQLSRDQSGGVPVLPVLVLPAPPAYPHGSLGLPQLLTKDPLAPALQQIPFRNPLPPIHRWWQVMGLAIQYPVQSFLK